MVGVLRSRISVKNASGKTGGKRIDPKDVKPEVPKWKEVLGRGLREPNGLDSSTSDKEQYLAEVRATERKSTTTVCVRGLTMQWDIFSLIISNSQSETLKDSANNKRARASSQNAIGTITLRLLFYITIADTDNDALALIITISLFSNTLNLPRDGYCRSGNKVGGRFRDYRDILPRFSWHGTNRAVESLTGSRSAGMSTIKTKFVLHATELEARSDELALA
ncbi:hypothetical protein DBV15_09907 [Temnothorax longispinosus]|uniref:Uncharacterized protein n=1 Tax=Temnothorax longispinosus TaxID=300112 RepID=A0A4S2KBA7_9HYME|nr:hypothetical protein DBV15_09907 [Temnothorax longispinosus]